MRNLGLMDPAFLGGLGGLSLYDTDAAAYITAVEAADGQALETGVRDAINAFVLGCKTDGIWNAIKASCILAGARTLAGALVPLVGTAPTNFNFVAGDYNRKTGLVGNGSTKYLNSNRNNNADPLNSKHIAVYATTLNTETTSRAYIGATNVTGSQIFTGFTGAGAGRLSTRLHDGTTTTSTANLHTATGLFAASRNNSSNYTVRGSSTNQTITFASSGQEPFNIFIFARGIPSPQLYADARLAFYSIGESLDLALLDARVTALVNALAVAIP
jgi:hypothetical protein